MQWSQIFLKEGTKVQIFDRDYKCMFVPVSVCVFYVCVFVCVTVSGKYCGEKNRKLLRKKNMTYKRKYELQTWETIQICLKYKTYWEYCV